MISRLLARGFVASSPTWVAEQMAHARSLGIGINQVAYYDPLTDGTVPSGEFTHGKYSIFAQWLAGTVTINGPSEYLLDSHGPPQDNLAFIWSEYSTAVLDQNSWYACAQVNPLGLASTVDCQRVLAGHLNWDFVCFAMLTEIQGTYTLNLRTQTGATIAVTGGTVDLTGYHTYAVAYDRATDTVTAYCDRVPIEGLASIPNAGQYMPNDPANQIGATVGCWGNGSAPMLCNNTAFFTAPPLALIPQDGLKLWLKGEDLAGTDGVPVSTWPDASGNHNDAAQADFSKQPTLVVSGINGHKAIQVTRTAGSGDCFMEGTVDLGAPVGITTVYVVETGANGEILYATPVSQGDGGLNLFGCGNDPNFGAGWSDGGFNFGTGAVDNLQNNQTRYGIFVFDGVSTFTCYGVNSGSSFGANVFTSGNYRIATGDYGADQFDGLIAEIMMWNRQLTLDEINQVIDYINAKYTPIPTPPPGMKLWLKADAGVSLSGSNVTAWADQSGNGNNVAQSNGALQPAFTASSINSLPAVTFNATAGQQLANTLANLVPDNNNRTVIAVVKAATAWSSATVFDFRGSSQDFSLLMGIGGTAYVWSNAVGVSLIPSPPSINGVPMVMELFYDNAGPTLSLNMNAAAQTLLTSSPGGDTGATGFQVGNRTGIADQPFDGDICEILVYDHVLTGDELAQLRAYLTYRSGITF